MKISYKGLKKSLSVNDIKDYLRHRFNYLMSKCDRSVDNGSLTEAHRCRSRAKEIEYLNDQLNLLINVKKLDKIPYEAQDEATK